MPSLLQRLRDRAGAVLRSPRLPLLLALLAVALCLPALGAGWQLDDYFQRMVMLGRTAHAVEPMEAFALLRHDAPYFRDYLEWGAFPWWTAENLRIAFFRYLTVATVRLDYALWPDSAPLQHAHSLAWLAALVAAAALLYRRLMGTGVAAGLAALAYAVDEAHAGAATWLANRNALVATCFGILCLVAHDRWRRDGWRPGAWAGPLLLALALASGEMALATVGYLGAYALFLDRAGRRSGLFALGGHGAVLGVWSIVYWLGAFGVRGSGLYLDPIGDAAAFVAILPERVPFLMLGQWTAISADASWLLPAERARIAWWIGLAVTAVAFLVLLPLLRRDRVARFWTLGMTASLLPVAATFPSNRLLFFVGVGAMGLLAQFLVVAFGAASGERPLAWRVATRALGGVMVLFHLVLAPLMAPVGAELVRTMGEPTRLAVASLPTDPSLAERDLVVVTTPDYLTFVTMIQVMRAVDELPFPPRVRALSAGPTAVTLVRQDERTVRVELEEGLFAGPLGELYRARRDPLPPGTVVELEGLTITILAVDQGGEPNAIDYRFDRPLEDPSLFWVRWDDGVYVPTTPPAPGETTTLEPARGPFESMAELFPI